MGRNQDKVSPEHIDTPHSFYDKSDIHLGVSNPAAQRVLLAAFGLLQSGNVDGPAGDLAGCPADVIEYQLRIRNQLKRSGISQRLTSGLSDFPDIYCRIPVIPRALALLFKPSKCEQVTRLVGLNLEWYLDPSQPVKLIRLSTGQMLTLSWAATICGAIATASFGGLGWPVGIIGGISLLVYGLSLNFRAYFDDATLKQRAQFAEYYRYLKDSYSDYGVEDEL